MDFYISHILYKTMAFHCLLSAAYAWKHTLFLEVWEEDELSINTFLF